MASERNRDRKRNTKKIFTKKMQIKLMAIFAFVLLALVGLNVRIAYITAKSGDKYARKVLSQQQYDSRTIPFRRGEILDRNGNIMARSEKVYNVVLDCFAINADEDFIEPTISAVSATLGVDEAEIRKVITSEETKDSQYQVVKREVTMEDKQKYEDYTDLSVDRKLTDEKRQELENVQGVWFEEDFIRKYPFNSLASNVLGFSNDLNDGIVGLESYYDDVLNGVDGREFGYLNEDSELQRTTVEPTNGKSLVSTIDVNIQQVVEKYIKEFDDMYKGGPWKEFAGHGSKNTGVIVGNPNTGEILAMATNQGFDLNDPENLDGWYTKKQIEAMTDEEYVAALNGLWSNFCVSGAFELGSTYKPVVVASALEGGYADDSDHYYCNGYLQYGSEPPIYCDNRNGHQDETLSDVVKNSCNVGMMEIADKMGVDAFVKYQELFNFGKKTGIDLPNENAGILYNNNNMHVIELATNSFGQGFTASMIQEFAAFSTVVNGGNYYRPHMVKQVLDSKGGVAKDIDPLLLSQPVSSKNSSLLKEYLEAVVKEGTGQKAQISGYRIGGKTGTAETLPRGEDRYIVSFIGAVPIDDPQVVIYTVVDEPNVEDQEIGGYSMEISKKILSEILPYLGIYPTEEITDDERNTLGMKTGENADGTTDGTTDGTADGTADGTDGNSDGTAQNGLPQEQNYVEPLEDTGEPQENVWDDGVTNEDLQLEQ